MFRAGLTALVLVSASGCSLILDFSPGAIPSDAVPDPYTQEECDYKEPNNQPSQAQLLTTADLGPAAICRCDTEDRDFYRFTVPPGTAKISVRVMFASGPNGD